MAEYRPWKVGVTSRSGHGFGPAGVVVKVNARSEPEACAIACRDFKRQTSFTGLPVGAVRS